MMDSCMAEKPSRVGPVEVNDVRRDLFHDFSSIPITTQDSFELEKEHLRVFLRIRPFTFSESNSGEAQDCVTLDGSDTVVLKAPRYSLSSRVSERPMTQTAQRFTFSQVYGQDTSQRQMFEGTVLELVREVLEGGNSLVFTYGVTNTGKTFTFLGPERDGGLLPRSLAVIFNSIEGRVYSHSNLKPQRCRDFTRLTTEQQEEENTSKKNLLRLLKESDCQRSTSSLNSTCRSTFLEGSSLNSDSSVNSGSERNSFSLDVSSNTKFSVWVSFCEIYNENIHDLLEQLPSGTHKRTVLRLSQDVKGNCFVKDLRWVQVNSAEEAYKVMKIGKKNQSFSATRLNQLSSRSHSIFSIRILRIEDVGVPRVHTISELSLCDLAGSERCAKTQNRGDRLKEAGNINTSLLTLGKCINALRLNQHAKFQQHVPFRESKLTHYLQGFFCGRGKACMIVNINQCASMYDETLNVLKFSALAQKVVVVNPKPVLPSTAPQRSARDVSMIINEANGSQWARGRKSSMVAWETSLEDVNEDEDDDEDDNEALEQDEEEEECSEEEESMLEETILEPKDGEMTTMEDELEKRAEDRLALETRIREEVTAEFTELFTQMENDYKERLANEREIIEERAEKRLEILKNLVSKSVIDSASISTDQDSNKEDKVSLLEDIISTMRQDLLRIRKDAEAAQSCLVELPEDRHLESTAEVTELKTQVDHLSQQLSASQQHIQTQCNELETMRSEKKQSHDLLEETKQSLERQTQKVSDLMEICLQKDEMISKLEQAMDNIVEQATRDRDLVESITQELSEARQSCRRCHGGEGARRSEDGQVTVGEKEGNRKRRADSQEETCGEPAAKRTILEEEIWRLQEENDKNEQTISRLREETQELREKAEGERRALGEESARLGEELERRQEELEQARSEQEQARSEQAALEKTVEKLTADLEEQSIDYESLLSSLESERRESARLTKENKALVKGMFQLQSTAQTQGSEVTSLVSQLKEKTDSANSLSKQLDATMARLQDVESQSEKKTQTIEDLNKEVECLTQKVDGLRQEVEVASEEEKRRNMFCATIEELQKESRAALERSAQKSQQIEELQGEITQLKEQLSHCESVCSQLREEIASHKEESSKQLDSWQAEKGLLVERSEGLLVQLKDSEVNRARGNALEKQLSESVAQCAALRQKLEEMNRAQEEEKKGSEKEKEELRLALSDQQETAREQEKRLEEKMAQVEALTQELERLKENHIQQRALEEKIPVVEELRAELQKLQKRKEQEGREEEAEEKRRQREFESVKGEMERLQELNSRKDKQVRELQEQLSLHTTEVLDTSGGRFPCPEVEIQFSPLQPNTLNLRRHGEDKGVTLKITRGSRKKRKSNEMEDPVQSENKRNRLRGTMRDILQTPSVNSTPTSLKGKKDGTLQKIGDLIQSSPSLLGGKAKVIMGLVSGHSVGKSSPATEKKVLPKRAKRKLYKTDISSPQMIGQGEEEKESHHSMIKTKLRSRTARK